MQVSTFKFQNHILNVVEIPRNGTIEKSQSQIMQLYDQEIVNKYPMAFQLMNFEH